MPLKVCHVATPMSSSHTSYMADGQVSFSVEAVVRGYHMPTRTSGSLSMAKNCRAREKLATGSMLSLWP